MMKRSFVVSFFMVWTILIAALLEAYSQPLEISTLAGGQPGKFRFGGLMSDAAVDADGNVFVAQWSLPVIWKILPDGNISIFAGNPDKTGTDDGPRLDALFREPRSLAIDSDGNIFVTDSRNHTVRKIDTDGMVTTIAGQPDVSGSNDGTGAEATFNYPIGIAIADNGNLFVSNQRGGRICRITPEGVVTTFSEVGGSPEALDFDSMGNLIVGAYNPSAVYRIAPDGIAPSPFEEGNPNVITDLNTPIGIAVDDEDYIYAATHDHTIVRISPDNVIVPVAGMSGNAGSADGTGSEAQFSFPSGIALDEEGNLIIADRTNSAVRKMTPEGAVTTIAGQAPGSEDGPAELARFRFPHYLAIGSGGEILVTDYGNYTVRAISTDGLVTTIAGEAGLSGSIDGTGAEARFSRPDGIVMDAEGGIFVVDNTTIRRIDNNNVVTTVATVPGQPVSICLAPDGNFFIADSGEDVIRKMTPDGMISIYAGEAGNPGSVDGPVNDARFNSPSGITADGLGNLYVADYGNSTIRKITPDGEVVTIAGEPGVTGSSDGTRDQAHFNFPKGIATDTSGNIWVADTSNRIIRLVTPDGLVTTVAGKAGASGFEEGTGEAARFLSPTGIAVSSTGTVYVADAALHTIRIGNLVTTSSGPRLEIVRSIDSMTLSWPKSAEEFTLEAISLDSWNLPWIEVSDGITLTEETFSFEQKFEDPNRIFRLRKQ